MSIPTLVISKDRAQQLNLLLNSIEKNAPGMFDITVIFKHSSDAYIDAYVELTKDYPYVNWQCEVNCNDQLYEWLNSITHPLVAFFTDDCIFYRENTVKEKDLMGLFSMQNLFTFTYRLGNNITIQDYTRGNTTDRPRMFVEKYNSLLWDYTQCRNDHSFGWECGLDGYIYRTEDLIHLLDNKSFDHFTKLEGLMIGQSRNRKNQACMMGCPFYSTVFVEQCNITHNSFHHTTREFNANIKELNDLFLEGSRIDLNQMNFNNLPNCTHGEKKFIYKRI